MLVAMFVAIVVMSDARYALAIHHYSCTLQQPLSNDIILLHGWGCASQSWQTLIPALQNIANVVALDLPGFGASKEIPEFNLVAVIALIAAQLPEKCILIGWSLGGMLAVQLAARYPKKISHVVTLATNAKFVTSSAYEMAMPLAINRQFNKSFAADPQATLKLFSGLLAQGDTNERALLKQMRGLMEPEKINPQWLQALELLAQLDNRDAFAQLTQPGLHLLAQQDALIPVAAAQALAQLNPQQHVQVIAGAAHALHWSQPELVVQTIHAFLQSSQVPLGLGCSASNVLSCQSIHSIQSMQLKESDPIEKKQVAHSFSRAAATYDSVAGLQRRVGKLLFEKLTPDLAVQVVLDLGCGTGYFTPQLQLKFPQALVVGVDIAEGMLQFAKAKWKAKWGHNSLMAQDVKLENCSQANDSDPTFRTNSTFREPICVCADAEFLPFASQSVDIVYSNFAMQWCANLPLLFAELHRVLKPGGQIIFTTLGPATLHELKSAWQQVDTNVHVNQFHERVHLFNHLHANALQVVEFEHNPEVMQFTQLSELTRSLKALGAQNINRGRANGLTGRKKIQALKQAYENFRSNNLLPATYDVFYLKVTTP